MRQEGQAPAVAAVRVRPVRELAPVAVSVRNLARCLAADEADAHGQDPSASA